MIDDKYFDAIELLMRISRHAESGIDSKDRKARRHLRTIISRAYSLLHINLEHTGECTRARAHLEKCRLCREAMGLM